MNLLVGQLKLIIGILVVGLVTVAQPGSSARKDDATSATHTENSQAQPTAPRVPNRDKLIDEGIAGLVKHVRTEWGTSDKADREAMETQLWHFSRVRLEHAPLSAGERENILNTVWAITSTEDRTNDPLTFHERRIARVVTDGSLDAKQREDVAYGRGIGAVCQQGNSTPTPHHVVKVADLPYGIQTGRASDELIYFVSLALREDPGLDVALFVENAWQTLRDEVDYSLPDEWASRLLSSPRKFAEIYRNRLADPEQDKRMLSMTRPTSLPCDLHLNSDGQRASGR